MFRHPPPDGIDHDNLRDFLRHASDVVICDVPTLDVSRQQDRRTVFLIDQPVRSSIHLLTARAANTMLKMGRTSYETGDTLAKYPVMRYHQISSS